MRISGGMKEFVGRLGTIENKEGKLYRVRLNLSVSVPGVGLVRDDLWESRYLRTVRAVRSCGG